MPTDRNGVSQPLDVEPKKISREVFQQLGSTLQLGGGPVEVSKHKIVVAHGDMDQPLIEDLLRPSSPHPNQLEEFVSFKIVARVV